MLMMLRAVGSARQRLLTTAFDALYGPGARIYDRLTEVLFSGEWRRWQATALAAVAPGGRIVELGCGTGAFASSATAGYASWIAVDVSSRMLAVAARRSRPPGLVFLSATAAALPIRDDASDAVIDTFPSGYIADPAVAIEIRRVLKQDGRLVVVLAGEIDAKGIRRRFVRALSRVIGRVTADGRQYPIFSGFRGHWTWRESDHGRALVYVGHPIRM
jgi:ubiquinone/menaquinone biosynthesis C-methylase UbiE